MLNLIFAFLIANSSHAQRVNCEQILDNTFSAPHANFSVIQDFDALAAVIKQCWANRAVHETRDGFNFDHRVATFRAQLAQQKDLTFPIFISLAVRWIESLHDGHMWVNYSQWLTYQFNKLKFIPVREGLALADCGGDAAACANLHLPLLVESVDGEPIDRWLNRAKESVEGSTDQGRIYSAPSGLSFYAEIKDGLPLHLKRPQILRFKGVAETFILPWHTNPTAKPVIAIATSGDRQCVSSSTIGDTWILRIATWECTLPTDPQDQVIQISDERLYSQIHAAIAQAPTFTRWMIDLRGNGGGLPQTAQTLITEISSLPIFYFHTRIHGSPETDSTVILQPSPTDFPRRDDLRDKPLWLLTDGGCFSQCYLFVQALVNGGRAKIVGSSPDGGVGGPTSWQAPSGKWSANLPIWDVWDRNGRTMEGVVLKPSVRVLPELHDLRPDLNDVVLSLAVKQTSSHLLPTSSSLGLANAAD